MSLNTVQSVARRWILEPNMLKRFLQVSVSKVGQSLSTPYERFLQLRLVFQTASILDPDLYLRVVPDGSASLLPCTQRRRHEGRGHSKPVEVPVAECLQA